jgi:hypothetical protein
MASFTTPVIPFNDFDDWKPPPLPRWQHMNTVQLTISHLRQEYGATKVRVITTRRGIRFKCKGSRADMGRLAALYGH